MHIIGRGYDHSIDPRYMKVGKTTYYFIHGHQFDRSFKFFGRLSAIPGLMASLNNSLTPWLPPKGLGSIIAFLILLLISRAGPSSFFILSSQSIIFFVVVIATGLIGIPKVFTALQGPLWKYVVNPIWRALGYTGKHSLKPKYKTGRELTRAGSWWSKLFYDRGSFYDPSKDTIQADAIVLGHTHVPEISLPDETGISKALINTGSWVTDDKPTPKNTVVAIDNKGTALLKWEGTEKGFTLIGSFH